MKINKLKYIKNLVLVHDNLIEVSLGMVLIGSVIYTNNDPVMGIAAVSGGIYIAGIAQDYRNMLEATIKEEKKEKRLIKK